MRTIFYLLMTILIMNCKSQTPETLWEEAKLMRTENNMKESIINLESIIEKYPEHNLAAEAQFQKADIYLNDIKDFDFAIEEFEKVIRQYPLHEVAKNSLFMIAYIYNNYLSSYTDAIDNYNLFLNQYPDDELIPSVEYELERLFEIKGIIDSLNSIVSQRRNIQPMIEYDSEKAAAEIEEQSQFINDIKNSIHKTNK